MVTALFPKLGFGLGLRADHYSDVLDGRASVSWFEVISENYMETGGRPLFLLKKIREKFPIVLHGVSLSIGSVDPLQKKYLRALKQLSDEIEPAWISDHLCWTGVNGENLHDLLPLPYTEETIKHVVDRVHQVQDFLKRRIMLENVSSYLTFSHSEMTEWQFLTEVSQRADCGLLLDINNIYVSSMNHGFDALDFIRGVPSNRVGQFHLAGHSVQTLDDGRKFLIDTHDHPVCDDVWKLYAAALHHFGDVSTMIEWDANVPSYRKLESEIQKARKVQESVFETKTKGPTKTKARTLVKRITELDEVGHHRA